MTALTPPQLAKLWGISPDKVLGWIRAGELRALNVATKRGGRPAYRIEPEALAEFKARRETFPAVKPAKRMRPIATKDFFP